MEQNEKAQKAAEVYMKGELEKLESSLGGGAQSKQPTLGDIGGGSSTDEGWVTSSGEGAGKPLRKVSERATLDQEEQWAERESSDEEAESGGSAEHPRILDNGSSPLASTLTGTASQGFSPSPKLIHPHLRKLQERIRHLANVSFIAP